MDGRRRDALNFRDGDDENREMPRKMTEDECF
jgi:hypothetical protein